MLPITPPEIKHLPNYRNWAKIERAAARLSAVFFFVRRHLREHVGQKEHLAVAGARHQRVLGVACVLDQVTRVAHLLFATHALQIGLPALTVGRIGEHEVELAGGEGIV